MRKLNRNEIYAYLKESLVSRVSKTKMGDLDYDVDRIIEGDFDKVKECLEGDFEWGWSDEGVYSIFNSEIGFFVNFNKLTKMDIMILSEEEMMDSEVNDAYHILQSGSYSIECDEGSVFEIYDSGIEFFLDLSKMTREMFMRVCEVESNLHESMVKKIKQTDISSVKDEVDSVLTDSDVVGQLLENIYVIASKMKGTKFREYGPYSEYTIPCCSIERDMGSLEYPEGIICFADTKNLISFEWNLNDRGVYKLPNYGTVDFKDKKSLKDWCYYGFDENIPNFIVPAKYSRKQEWNGRTLIHHAYNVFLESIHYHKSNGKIVLRWLWGCKKDGYSVDDEMKKDFDSCSKIVKKKIIQCLKNKLDMMQKSLLS